MAARLQHEVQVLEERLLGETAKRLVRVRAKVVVRVRVGLRVRIRARIRVRARVRVRGTCVDLRKKNASLRCSWYRWWDGEGW